jgi:hypothetical protein
MTPNESAGNGPTLTYSEKYGFSCADCGSSLVGPCEHWNGLTNAPAQPLVPATEGPLERLAERWSNWSEADERSEKQKIGDGALMHGTRLFCAAELRAALAESQQQGPKSERFNVSTHCQIGSHGLCGMAKDCPCSCHVSAPAPQQAAGKREPSAQPTEELREHPRDSYGEVQASISGPALDAQREKFDWKWAERVLECDCDSGIYDNQVCDKCQLLAALRSALADADSRTTAAARTDSVKVRHAFLSIENLAHQAWTDKKNIRQLFERIEKIAIEQGRALSPSSSTKADRCLKNTGTGRSAT